MTKDKYNKYNLSPDLFGIYDWFPRLQEIIQKEADDYFEEQRIAERAFGKFVREEFKDDFPRFFKKRESEVS